LSLNFSLDIDDCICDFTRGFFAANGLTGPAANEAWKKPRDYWYSWLIPQTQGSPEASFNKVFDDLKRERDFWVNLPVLDNYIPDSVKMYLTARECPNEWTREWLTKNGFPDLPLVNTQDVQKSKAVIAAYHGMQGHVDDKSETFIDCYKTLPDSFLMSRPWNIDVSTVRRVYRLEELDWRA
jgi:hypothetical protein